jgi:hypothetical protein
LFAQVPLQQLQKLLLSQQAVELQGLQHPVQWHLLVQQHRQQLSALAGIASAAASAVQQQQQQQQQQAGGSFWLR